jgi:high frequency lysogenization protein
VQDKYENITIALAGILQAISLMRELTQTGRVNDNAFQASIYSILQVKSDDAQSVYGGVRGVKLGLEKVLHAFDTSQTADRLQSRYMLSLIHLQKKLSRSPKMLEAILKRLQQVQKQVDYFSLTHPTVIANLADIYLNTISTFRFRILIMGNQNILHVRENMEKVRALLLAGIRSAILWRQMGGSRLQLLFSRKKIKDAAEKILRTIEHSPVEQKDMTL